MDLTCPRCGWSKTRFSMPSGFIDGILRIILLAPIRCRKCRNRFYRFSVVRARFDSRRTY
jgi:ribosomal protein S27E